MNFIINCIVLISIILFIIGVFLIFVINNVQKYKWAALIYCFLFDKNTYNAYKTIKQLSKSIPLYTMWNQNLLTEDSYYVYDYNVWCGQHHLVISSFYKPLINDIIISNTLN